MERYHPILIMLAFGVTAVACSNVLGYEDLAFDPPSAPDAAADTGTDSTTQLDAAGGSPADASVDKNEAGDAGVGGSSQAGSGGAGGISSEAGVDGAAGSAGSGSAGAAGEAGAAGTGGTTDPPPLDLAAVTWLHTDVSAWPVTVDLASVTFDGSQICLNHDIAGMSWPIQLISGTEVVANPWVFIYRDDRWYGATWEWLRPPGQTCKNQSSVAGDHIKAAPFDAASGWQPSSGETLYFMVSGLARLGLSNVQERSEPVQVTWP